MKQLLFLLPISFLIMPYFLYKHWDLKSARIDKVKSFITYHMVHPMHSWDGTSKEVDGVVQYDDKTNKISKVAIVAKVSTFDSKNSNRDSHMMEVTEAIKYPTVSFVSSAVVEEGSTVDVNGTISFHGVSKPIHFTAKETVNGKRKIISGEFVLLLEDFAIERPSMMMMKTENEMKMNFSVEFELN